MPARPDGATALVRPDRAAPESSLRRAAVRATLAPSVHNTQPWRLLIGNGRLDVLADYSRQLRVVDPVARQLLISCGCALFNARVSLAADGFGSEVVRSETAADLLARVVPAGPPDLALAALDPAVEARRTNRKPFLDEAVPDDVVAQLQQAAAAEGGIVRMIEDAGLRATMSRLCHRAEDLEYADPAYRAELERWVTADENRRDGVGLDTIPQRTSRSGQRLPIRDFDVFGRGRLAVEDEGRDCLLILGSPEDDGLAWIRTGEALERLWLEATRRGFALTPFTQPIEVASARRALTRKLGIDWSPQLLLRIGRASATPATRRRRLVDVLHEVGQAARQG